MTSRDAHREQLDSELELADQIEDVVERISDGEVVTLEEVQREHPQHAERLSEVWPAVKLMNAFAALGAVDSTATCGDTELLTDEAMGTLGDFRIIDEIGRGGMGIVYEAVQISLSRAVALKVLPFAAMLDSKRLQRFRNEARAAALLDHPHIVPIYAVNQARGVHFYAMQLIRGVSLAEAIAELATGVPKVDKAPSPDASVTASAATIRTQDDTSPRACQTTLSELNLEYNGAHRFKQVAELGLQAAQALHHAHENGVIHRDIKPGNLLLDGSGKLFVTDFGLARIDHGPAVTLTGDLLGTLRYMSPEQVDEQAVVDHRTDIYSLGATLYELICFRPMIGS